MAGQRPLITSVIPGTREAPRSAGAEARAQALARLGFLLSAVHDPVEAAQFVVNTAFDFFKWDATFLALYKADTGLVTHLINIDTVEGQRRFVPAVLEDKAPSAMMRKVMEQGAQLVLRGKHQIEADATVPFGDTARLSRSLMYVPVRLENLCIGVLSVQSYEPSAYNANDLTILQGLADHAAGALGRLQVEAELRASEERLRLAIESSGLGAWEYEPAAGQFTLSEQCLEILGRPQKSKVSFSSFLEQLEPAGQTDPAEMLRALINEGSHALVHLQCRVRRPDKTAKWIILAAKKYVVEQSRGRATLRLIGTVLNITEQKNAEEALRAAQKQLSAHARELEKTVQARTASLQETVSELEAVSYALKHDMRAPLRAMQAYAQLTEEEMAGCDRPKALEHLGMIRMASKRLDQLIQDSLTYNRAVLEKLELRPVNLDALLRGLVGTYPQLHASSAEITIQSNLPAVLGNEAALTQCFGNLLDNAVKFVGSGQRAIVRVWSETRGEFIRIWVEDRGIGIPASSVERIFDMFQRGTRHYGGTGIGLAIARKLVQRLGGTIGVESEEGRGSRFWVDLRAT